MLGRALPYLILLAACVFSVSLFALLGEHNLDADMASEMVLADQLNQEGALLAKGWYYSTELRVVSPLPFYQLGLLLFDSWHAARTFAVALLVPLLAVSFLYLMRSFGFGKPMVYCAACLVLPVSLTSMSLLVFGQFYSMYFILICLLLGTLVRTARRTLPRPIGYALLFALGVWGGANGVRMLMMFAAPMGLAAFFLLFSRLRTCKTVREALATREAAHFLLALLTCVAILCGYLFNTLVLSEHYAFKSFSDTKFYNLNWDELLTQLNHWPQYFGFTNRVTLISLDGLINALAFAIVVAMVFSTARLLMQLSRLSEDERLLLFFTVFSVIIGLMMNCMTIYGSMIGLFTISYYLPGFLLLFSMVFIHVEKTPMQLKGMKSALLLCMCAVFALQSVQYVRKNLRASDAEYETTAQYLLDNGYANGFSTFWNANLMTEATDGQIEVYTYDYWTSPELYAWLQKKSHLEQLPEGKVFVFVDYKEAAEYAPLARPENLLCEVYNGYLYTYDSAQEVVDIQRSANAR